MLSSSGPAERIHPQRTLPLAKTMMTDAPLSKDESSANEIKTFYLDLEDCNRAVWKTFSAVKGVLYLSSNKTYQDYRQITRLCVMELIGRAGHFLFVLVEQLSEPCYDDRYAIDVLHQPEFLDWLVYGTFYTCSLMSSAFSVHVKREERVYLRLAYYPQHLIPSVQLLPRFKISFQINKNNFLSQLNVTFTSNTTGTISPWWFDNREIYSCAMNAEHLLSVPDGYLIMLSAPYVFFNIGSFGTCMNHIYVFLERFPAYRYGVCDSGPMKSTVWNSTIGIALRADVCISQDRRFNKGVKLHFSYHKSINAPREENGKFDCSGPDYASFRQHLHCNLEPECQGGEDEGGHCPYSSPACNGSVAVGSKCYQYFSMLTHSHFYSAYTPGFEGNPFVAKAERNLKNWFQAQLECEKKGGNLAMAKSQSEWKALSQLFQYGKKFWPAWIGLYTGSRPVLNVYKYMLKWIDNSVVLNVNSSSNNKAFRTNGNFQYYMLYPFISLCGLVIMGEELMFEFGLCLRTVAGFICEFDTGANEQHPSISRPGINRKASAQETNQCLVTCRDGHLTHMFLACDPVSACETQEAICPAVSSYGFAADVSSLLYTCDDKKTAVPYTLVCDFKQDCRDGSDEAFCYHDHKCSGFSCANGQCIDADKRCEGVTDCWDESDEDCTSPDMEWLTAPRMVVVSPHTMLTFDSKGRPSMTPINASSPCPETHFQCLEGYCLPVYLLCNGVRDCPESEDELDCHSFTCPGFYRCRASRVCVHTQHLCDGLPQCPQHDDELLCQATCPETCSCQGLSFVCPQPFIAGKFPDVRYLDASGSGMTPEGLRRKIYLVWLRLSSCQLRKLRKMNFPNLRILDLSHNNLTSLNMEVFLSLPNLRSLRLTGNPLTAVRSSARYGNLTALDVSETTLRYFDSRDFAAYPRLQSLNLSFTSVETIDRSGFTYTPHLVELDLRGSPVREFPVGLMADLTQLSVVYADNYRLCCGVNLPGHLHPDRCMASADMLSSCADLVNSGSLRVTLWILSVSSLAGNCGCLVFRVLTDCAVTSPFNILLTNLGVSDFLMGVYLVLVGGADLIYRGHYSSYHTQWISSMTCAVASFLSGLSNQVSALIIGLISLDRFLAIRVPARRVHFTKWSVTLVCVTVWAVGTVTSITAFVFVTSQWQVDGGSAMCNSLHVTRNSLRGQNFSFGVVILLNWLLCVLMAAGHAAVYWTLYSFGSHPLDSGNESMDLSLARRVTTIVTSNLLYRSVMATVYLADFAGSSVPGAVRVFVIAVLFPLSSALNPFLYLLSLRQERDRLAKREKLISRLTKRLKHRRSIPNA